MITMLVFYLFDLSRFFQEVSEPKKFTHKALFDPVSRASRDHFFGGGDLFLSALSMLPSSSSPQHTASLPIFCSFSVQLTKADFFREITTFIYQTVAISRKKFSSKQALLKRSQYVLQLCTGNGNERKTCSVHSSGPVKSGNIFQPHQPQNRANIFLK